jgi:PAS domain S-box-containing protein
MSQNKRFGGGVSKRTAEALVWVAIGLLVPLTLYLVMVSTVHLFILLAWLGLALIALSYALLVQLSSHHTVRELERAREHHAADHGQLITIINSMSVGMMSVSANGTIRLYNAALLALIDTNESITGKNVADVFNTYNKADDSRVDLMSLVEKRYMTRREDIVLKYDDNDLIRLGITINPVREAHGAVKSYIFIVEDITKEKSLEEERDEFISVISHELRTPITIVEGSISNAQLLLSRGAQPAALKQTFDEAHEQIVFLANMVNDLGTLSRAERGVGDTLEPIDIDALAAELHSKYEPRARERKLHFNLDIVGHIGTVNSSPLYLEEVLQNFITNSIKYTQEGSVTLHIRKTDKGILFAVKDTGIGISKTDQKRIFEKFYRSEDYRTRETSGTGLGLYVVQKLAHKLGVTVEVKSRLNHGSTFSFVLPLK